jgi:CRISPR/Cas system-associated protein Csx1
MENLTLNELQVMIGNLAHGMALLSEAFTDYAKSIGECMMTSNTIIEDKFQEIDQSLVKINEKIDTAGSLLELSLCGPHKN